MVVYNLPNYERQTTILDNTNNIINQLPTIGKTPRRQFFYESGSWTAPVGVTRIFVTGGGGGGSGSLYIGTATVGNAGGVTSFGDLLSLSGGGGGTSNSNFLNARQGRSGGPGGQNGGLSVFSSGFFYLGVGGSAGNFKGGQSTTNTTTNATTNYQADGGYCSGGGSVGNNSGAAGCGGSGDFVMQYPLQVVPGTSYAITIGQGGLGAISGVIRAGNGGNGILIVEWWE